MLGGIRKKFIIEYRRLSELQDFQFSGVIHEEDGKLLFKHRDIFSNMSKKELEKKSLKSLDDVVRKNFGPLVNRTTAIASVGSLDEIFNQYLAVALLREKKSRISNRK